MFARLRRVPARLSARPGHMHSEGRIICRASRHLIRRVVSFDRPIHPSSGCSFLPLGTFLFCIRDFHVRCSRTHPPSWERTASECIIHLRSLFVSPPHPFPPVFNSCAVLSFLICLRGFGWRIHCGVEVTVLSTNKQHSLSYSSHIDDKACEFITAVPIKAVTAPPTFSVGRPGGEMPVEDMCYESRGL